MYFTDNGHLPNTGEQQARYLERMTGSEHDVVLAIVEAASHRHIGNVGLHQINWVHRTASLGIVIGEKEYWGKGFGKQAWRLITRYGFETLNLNKICATVLAGHARSLACAQGAGFAIEGTQKQQFYKRGTYHDLLLLGVTLAAWDRVSHG
jgi:RimJ/RimL family protein N-acetyltransferase